MTAEFDIKPYLERWLENATPELQAVFDKENEYLLENIKKGSVVLDVGCGFGRHIGVLLPIAKNLYGIDRDRSVFDFAAEKFKGEKKVELFLEESRKTHFKNGAFDAIICMGNTFGNMADEKVPVLKEMKRILKKGGSIIISVFSENALRQRKEDLEIAGFHIKKTEKGRIITSEGLISEQFSREELEGLFSQAGLKVEIEELTPISYVCEAQKN
jgi:SAM-dependent methyltransferase